MKDAINRMIIVVVISIGTFVIGLFFLGRYVQNQVHIMQRDKLLLERNVGVQEIQNQFSIIETFILDVESYLQTHDSDEYLFDYLVEIDERHDFVYSLYLGRPDKTMVNSSGFIPPETFDLTTREWYQKAIVNNDIIYTNAFLNATGDRLIITVSYAVYDDENQLIGVVGTDIDLDTITNYVNQQNNHNYYGFLVDNEGFVLAHPSLNTNELSLKLLDNFGVKISDLDNEKDISGKITFDDEEGYIAYEKLEDSSYYYGVFMTSKTFNQTSALIGAGVIVFLSLGVVLSIFIVLGFQLLVINPTKRLVKDIDAIDISKEDTKQLIVTKNGFKSTRKAFNRLLTLNDSFKKQLNETNVKLSNGIQRFDLLLSSASDIVFELDSNGVYKKVYGNSKDIFNIPSKEMTGKTFKQVFHDKEIDDRDDLYIKVMSGNKISYNWIYKDNGNTKFLQTNLSPLFNQEKEVVGIVGVTRDVSEVQNQYEELLYISTHDYLTDLYNRRVITDEIEQLEMKKDYPYTIVNIDLNGLKLINDALGHQVGDLALQRTAEVLIKNTLGKDIVARVGGDEFSILLKNTSDDQAMKFKRKLESAFSKETIKNITLSVAIGFAVRKDDSTSVNEIRKLAENDMYRQKILDKRSVKNKTISAILKTLNDKHELEKHHSINVSKLSRQLGEALKLNDSDLKELETAALFHDIGKISIPDDILYKTGSLTDEEYKIMKTHTTIGYDILSAADEYSNLAIYASSHHEKYNGTGYPKGLKGNDIPLFSRIICIADAYEAMTADRPYRKKMSISHAVNEIVTGSNKQFDPFLAKLFVTEVLKRDWK